MRILLLNQAFYPDVAATAQHAHDLARHLVAHGHEVSVIASRSIYGQTGATLRTRETLDGIEIHRVGRSLFGKVGIIARLFDFGMFYLAATFKALTVRRPDVVICFTTPPFIVLVGVLLKALSGSKLVYWMMDVYPDVLVANGLIKSHSLLTRLLEAISRFCIHHADRTVVLGRCMRHRVLEKGADGDRVVHLGVWSDHEEVSPIERGSNPYRGEWELGDRFVVMYSGNFGIVHDVWTMCEAARMLQDDPRIVFAFVGGGKRKAEVEASAKQHNLHARLEPYQPRERLDALLSCADLHLVSLLPGYEGLVVPSKLFGIMAAGRPAIVIGPQSSEVAMVVAESGCGVVIAPGDATSLANAIRNLADNPAQVRAMGDRARQALLAQHDRQRVCEGWQRMLEELVAPEAHAFIPPTPATGLAATDSSAAVGYVQHDAIS